MFDWLIYFPECKSVHKNLRIDETFNISTPNYPNFYSNNLICTWTIVSPDNGSFIITFHSFNLYSSRDNEDSFNLWKGQDKLEDKVDFLTGVQMISSGAVMVIEERMIRIHFISGVRFAHRGFLIQIERSDVAGKNAFKLIS